jgi:hypothetical protein
MHAPDARPGARRPATLLTCLNYRALVVVLHGDGFPAYTRYFDTSLRAETQRPG